MSLLNKVAYYVAAYCPRIMELAVVADASAHKKDQVKAIVNEFKQCTPDAVFMKERSWIPELFAASVKDNIG